MQRTRFANMQCPIARGLERVGECWSILILRDAFYGLSRFDEFEKSLGISPSMLTRRLNALVEQGMLEKTPYSEHPPRFAYQLTQRGLDFRPVLLTLLAWGNQHFAAEGASVLLLDAQSGQPAEPVLIDANTAKRIGPGSHIIGVGPAAEEAVAMRIAATAARRQRGGAAI
jgi:DNA-binding HxlR family transcriptional regulator